MTLFVLSLIALAFAVRVVWQGWQVRFKSPVDILNDDLARQRARRRR